MACRSAAVRPGPAWGRLTAGPYGTPKEARDE
jgi:hypothetical protein